MIFTQKFHFDATLDVTAISALLVDKKWKESHLVGEDLRVKLVSLYRRFFKARKRSKSTKPKDALRFLSKWRVTSSESITLRMNDDFSTEGSKGNTRHSKTPRETMRIGRNMGFR